MEASAVQSAGVVSMRKLLFLVALGLIGWVVLSRYEGGSSAVIEMTSCAEARYFVEHCAASKMDGDGDGIPCEDQWCGHGG
jgi:hypothetical protein